jgi:hypothetical protein
LVRIHTISPESVASVEDFYQNTITFGYSQGNDFVLSTEAPQAVSLVLHPGQPAMLHLSGEDAVLHNQSPAQEGPVRDGDEISLAGYRFRVSYPLHGPDYQARWVLHSYDGEAHESGLALHRPQYLLGLNSDELGAESDLSAWPPHLMRTPMATLRFTGTAWELSAVSSWRTREQRFRVPEGRLLYENESAFLGRHQIHLVRLWPAPVLKQARQKLRGKLVCPGGAAVVLASSWSRYGRLFRHAALRTPSGSLVDLWLSVSNCTPRLALAAPQNETQKELFWSALPPLQNPGVKDQGTLRGAALCDGDEVEVEGVSLRERFAENTDFRHAATREASALLVSSISRPGESGPSRFWYWWKTFWLGES